MTKTVTVELPDGIVAIENVDLGMGPLLYVEFANGYSMTLDALALADHRCGAYLNAPGQSVTSDSDAAALDGQPIAGLAFGGPPVESWIDTIRERMQLAATEQEGLTEIGEA